MTYLISPVSTQSRFLSRIKVRRSLGSVNGELGSGQPDKAVIEMIKPSTQILPRVPVRIGCDKNYLELLSKFRGDSLRACAIRDSCDGQISGQWVYPKNKKVT